MPKILVADDNTNIQKMVTLALEERGISVVSVGNGEAAVRRIPDLNPDLVLADIFMPVRNGYEVCEFVKKDERFTHVPVILLVGAFDPLDEKEARRVGADGVLKKPFVPPDPLIAMVTAALEKNPRVAAEVAKAKEPKLPTEPEPLPNIELSSRPEPKPLPEFPAPSPEEAELVYGFSKGHHPVENGEEVEPRKAAPVANPRVEAGDDDDLNAASTESDWRRSAMDFEIPADVASKPAIPSIDELEPITFPSEKEYPPRRVAMPPATADVEKAEAVAPAAGSASFAIRQVEEEQPEPEQASQVRAIDFPETGLLQTAPETKPLSNVQRSRDSEPQPQNLPEPNSTSAGGHWLDAVTSLQVSQPTADWMEALRSPHARPTVIPEAEPEANTRSVEDTSALSQAPEAADWTSAAPEPFPASPSLMDARSARENQHAEQSGDQSFFAEESEHEVVAEPASEVRATEDSFKGPSATEPEIELDADEIEPPLSFQDPALVQPPAVHVDPEPLLVEDEASGPAQYGTVAEETAPLHTFFAPAPEAPVAAPEPRPAAASEFFVSPASEVPESPEAEIDERIPTMAPPNREALAHIPFLTPPPSFLAELNSGPAQEEPRAADPETVDTVVQKVLEKLQPQLQELLSQGLLKPLVENILQNEVTKKRS